MSSQPSRNITPFIVIPAYPGDTGSRPIPSSLLPQAVQNNNIQAVITNPDSTGGWNEYSVQFSCTITNLGAAESAAGLAEFYVGKLFSTFNPQSKTQELNPADVQSAAQLVGYASFQAPPGGTVTVNCQTLWTPGSSNSAQVGVLVQAYDIFADPLTSPFDVTNDRHVGMNDEIADLMIISQGQGVIKGTWPFNFDIGQMVGVPGQGIPPNADVWWDQETAILRQMVPENGAKICNLGTQVDFASLNSASLSGSQLTTSPIEGNDNNTNLLVNGDVFAVQTTNGNFAKVKVINYAYDIGIQWVTYAPVP